MGFNKSLEITEHAGKESEMGMSPALVTLKASAEQEVSGEIRLPPPGLLGDES